MSKAKSVQQKQRGQFEKRRMVKDAQTGEVIIQKHPGYNVPMIRDYLDQLLLELRIQQFEDIQARKTLKESDGPFSLDKQPLSQDLVEQLGPFYKKYASAVIACHVIDGKNATPEEIHRCHVAFTEMNIKRRDDQIGHLEALQDLFDESLHCAKFPFGISKTGPVQPMQVHSVRRWVDGD